MDIIRKLQKGYLEDYEKAEKIDDSLTQLSKKCRILGSLEVLDILNTYFKIETK